MPKNPSTAPSPDESLPGAGFQPAERLLISTPEQLKAISDPLRLSMLELIGKEALTVKQIATRLKQPPTKLYYHIAELEAAGFVTMVDTRVKSGIIEKYYRTAADNLSVDRKLLNVSAENPLPDLISVVFESTMQELSHSISAGLVNLEEDPAEENIVLARTLISLRREDVPRFIAKFRDLLTELDAADPRAGTDSVDYACLLAFYPRSAASGSDPT